MLIDTHAHISDVKFDGDRHDVINRAFSKNVKYIIEVGCDPESWDKAADVSKNQNIFCAFGIHPHDAVKFDDKTGARLKELLQYDKCVAVGEIGLDYHYDLSPRNIQRDVFIKQINMALELNKPAIIHCRSAYEEMLKILQSFPKLPKGVIHCFSGNLHEAEIVTGMGFLIGIDGPCTYPKSDKLKEVVLKTDINKLLTETDCPYLAPQSHRGQRNEPSYVVSVAEKIAEIKGMSFEDVCAVTSKNAVNLFGLEV